MSLSLRAASDSGAPSQTPGSGSGGPGPGLSHWHGDSAGIPRARRAMHGGT